MQNQLKKQNSTIFENLRNQPSANSIPNPANLESVKLVQKEIEKKIASRIKAEGREWEIQKAAEDVLEEVLLAHQNSSANSTITKMSNMESSRVAPAMIPTTLSTPRRQKQYDTMNMKMPQLQDDGFPGIYSLTGIQPQEEAPKKKKPKENDPTAMLLLTAQCSFVILFSICVSYDDQAMPKSNTDDQSQDNEDTLNRPSKQDLHKFYYFFQDVHVMIFIGFGFLMTFLKKYGYSAVSYNLLIAAIAIQWSVLCRGVFKHGFSTIPIDITTLINGDFAAAAVLITFGAILGVTNPLQLLTLSLIEVLLYALNEYIGTELFKAVDVGGSMFIHTFGAYFGLALSLVLRQQKDIPETNEVSDKVSDLFSMIGTVFLWMFWPSFNGVMAEGDYQHRAVINTVLSLTGSCIFSFGISALVSAENKFNMVHIQNASLAGGVAVGAVADLMIKPFGALIIGCLAGGLSVIGYTYITPFLQRKLGLHDTCGVHNLHGMPGVMAGLAGAIMAAIATEKDYKNGLYMLYPARSPINNSAELIELRKDLVEIEPGQNRTAGEQAIYQLAALGVTLLIAVVGGAITGLLLKAPMFGKLQNEELFDDTKLWDVPAEDEKSHQISSDDNGVTNQTFEMAGNEKNEF